MTELLPCWKCGSPAHMLPTIDARVMIACPESGLGAEHGAWVIEDTEAEAIAAWNTRAERTCTFSEGHDGNDTEKQELPRCSACGKDVDGAMCDMYADLGGRIVLEYPYRYCANCGARVVL